ncbi:MAG: AI-2E family transporter [Gemmatimonadales bacterium]
MTTERPPASWAALIVLATLATICALYFGREFLVPIALSVLFTGLLRPLVRSLEALRIPTAAGATVVLVVFLGAVGLGANALADPVRGWIAKAPQSLTQAEARLRRLRRPLQQITSAAERVESGGQPQSGQPSSGSPPDGPGIAARVFGTTTSLVGGIVEVLLLTFLLLASGDLFMQKLVKVLPFRGDKVTAVRIASEVEAAVSRYMGATALINLGQGVVVALAMLLLHMPSPVLWGVLTFFLEFIPYLGAAFMLIALGVVGLGAFDNVGHALLAPGAYLLITTLQNNLVSPVAYGWRLRLNPVAVLVGVLFWWYLWGVPGAFLSVPIIAAVKIMGDHIESLKPLGEFLAD